jgi:hypothetical protein
VFDGSGWAYINMETLYISFNGALVDRISIASDELVISVSTGLIRLFEELGRVYFNL